MTKKGSWLRLVHSNWRDIVELCNTYCFSKQYCDVINSPNEVFGDIMVLASPLRPPVDPDDVNTLNSKNIPPISFKFYMWVDTPLRYFAIEIWYSPSARTTFATKQHLYPPNL